MPDFKRRWFGPCRECRKMADLAFRPGTQILICARCMWPEDYRNA